MDIRSYLSELQQQLNSGVAREHAYRPALKNLFESTELITAINDPQRSEHGNPDFIFQDKQYSKLIRGYGESKDINISLDAVEKSEQMRRYYGYSNLVLTNGLDFRFFKNGEKYFSIVLGRLEDNKIITIEENLSLFWEELKNFLQSPPEKIRSAIRLSEIMGGKARRIRENINLYLKKENNELNAEIEKIYKVITDLLVHDLSTEKFADMYAQTLVYGLFIARYHDKTSENFTRQEARDLVPASNPFLRQFFDHIAGPQFDKRLGYIVDELCAVFQVSDIKTIIKQHFKQGSLLEEEVPTKDPIIHFYEDFLKEYDPELKKKMGAYYTPIPVVRYIVRAVDDILKTEFGLAKGLADSSRIKRKVKLQGASVVESIHRVQILDPAVGTATFLNELVKYVFENNFKGQEGRWASYVEEDLIPRLHGFELMMAPYTIAHLKLAMTLKELGYNKEFKKRLGIYLTNTLEEGIKRQLDLLTFGLQEAISKESQAAAEIKHNRPIMVIIGNPPYSGVSSNETEYANSLIQKYKVEPGGKQKLQERKHWLNDDYVKFIAFAEDMIEKNGGGIVAMITNHGYIDNPTFRGMRWHLKKTFNKIYILDLHGNSKKKEISPDGTVDENVFNIQQGVSIILAIKNKESKKNADTYRSNLFGKQKEKFKYLIQTDFYSSKWVKLNDSLDIFSDQSSYGEKEYIKGFKINEFFIKNVTGIVTMGDSYAIANSKDELLNRLEKTQLEKPTEAFLTEKYNLGKNYAKWLLGNINQIKIDANKLVQIDYRPFDTKYTYFDNKIIWRWRENIMKHFINHDNIGLVFERSVTNDVFVIKSIPEHAFLGTAGFAGQSAPLYLYHEDGSKTSNLNLEIVNKIENTIGKFSPENIFDYTYAVLYAPIYREKYKKFLKIDFPRVPYPKNERIFWQLVEKGKKLRELHLMSAPELEKLQTTYPVSGSGVVEKVEYKDGKVFINNEQYFGEAPEIAWNLYIGGYQPAQKWLKDRKGKTLSSDEIEHYQKIIKVLVETDKVMKEIDNIDFI